MIVTKLNIKSDDELVVSCAFKKLGRSWPKVSFFFFCSQVFVPYIGKFLIELIMDTQALQIQ